MQLAADQDTQPISVWQFILQFVTPWSAPKSGDRNSPGGATAVAEVEDGFQ